MGSAQHGLKEEYASQCDDRLYAGWMLGDTQDYVLVIFSRPSGTDHVSESTQDCVLGYFQLSLRD